MSPDLSKELDRLADDDRFRQITHAIRQLWPPAEGTPSTSGEIDRLQQSISLTETALASGTIAPPLVTLYQQLFRKLEAQIAAAGADDRHHFTVIIPVADRPKHLESCLQSLLQLCRLYHYGGFDGSHFPKVSVIVADDSKTQANIEQNRALTESISQQGVSALYFGQQQQLDELAQLANDDRSALDQITGKTDPGAFYHKGASLMRNISYLKLNRLQAGERTLFHFIDSDQEFRVNVETSEGDRELYAINYFHTLDRLFSGSDSAVVTGKVVGDPPVSPAVMAGNFLQDVEAFLQQMVGLSAAGACSFHQQKVATSSDASYHDMADLFGFEASTPSFSYRCRLTGDHDHRACFRHFADQLNRFFDGEHPTRKTYYSAEAQVAASQPARTLYTGNYTFKPDCLRYFIPFAPLKLRMAGPTLGRLIRAELGDRFISANLPMLHKRTVMETGVSEFRPGIQRQQLRTDLSGEFERQFFGDVMLFTIEGLTADGFPAEAFTIDAISQRVANTEAGLYQKYLKKQAQINTRLGQLKRLFSDPHQWWHQGAGLELATSAFSHFIADIEHNFGAAAEGYHLIGEGPHKVARLEAISLAIAGYPQDASSWQQTLAKTKPAQ